ncbi:MAG: phosphatase PAP2 family protein [Propionivibrio sp.]
MLALKSRSNMHCPWGIDRFGGSHAYLRLLDAVPDGWQAGHCFPAGHASVAMWLSVLAVCWLPRDPRRATFAFLAGIGAGFTLGWTQQMRGQHFLTHTLWTLWLSSALVVALIAVFSRPLTRCGGMQTRAFPEKALAVDPDRIAPDRFCGEYPIQPEKEKR